MFSEDEELEVKPTPEVLAGEAVALAARRLFRLLLRKGEAELPLEMELTVRALSSTFPAGVLSGCS